MIIKVPWTLGISNEFTNGLILGIDKFHKLYHRRHWGLRVEPLLQSFAFHPSLRHQFFATFQVEAAAVRKYVLRTTPFQYLAARWSWSIDSISWITILHHGCELSHHHDYCWFAITVTDWLASQDLAKMGEDTLLEDACDGLSNHWSSSELHQTVQFLLLSCRLMLSFFVQFWKGSFQRK